jgi:DNA-binding FadR family transcriptional regulator
MRARDSGAPTRRSAEIIARAIELDIIARDLPVGTRVGSEAELMERFGASRGVIREAVTLVESHMLAETRRGLGGGLVVAEPLPSVVEGIVSLYLARTTVSIEGGGP